MVAAGKDRPWEPFGVTEADFAAAPEHDGVRVVNVRPGDPGPDGQAGWWLRCAAVALGVLAAAAAVVSWDAQYTMVRSAKHVAVVAALEAGIPDVGAVIFAALGVALALYGRRALRPRALNAACVGISLTMNALAAGHGWRDLAIWVMPAAVYAVASDTLIGVVRAWAIARQHHGTLADDGPSLLGGGALWLLRLALAPPSTLKGFRDWVVSDCPVAPGHRPGHLAELAAVRRDAGQQLQQAEQRLALEARQRDEAVESAGEQARHAGEEAARARAAESLARSELDAQRSAFAHQAEQVRADATREGEAVRAWAGQQLDGLRAELQRSQQTAAGLLGEIQDSTAKQAADLELARDGLQTRAEKAERQADALRGERDHLAGQLHAMTQWPRTTRHNTGRSARVAAGKAPTKRDQMITLAAQRHDLVSLPLGEVSKLASGLAEEIGYSAGTARRELLAHVRALQSQAGRTDGGAA
jgi:hypothetical protein